MYALKAFVLSLAAIVLVACSSVQNTIVHSKQGVVAVMVEKQTTGSSETASGLGTGFFIDENVILTNNHVVEDDKQIKVAMENSSILYDAEVIHKDKDSDVATIKIKEWDKFKKENKYVVLPLTEQYSTLEDVYVIGHPWGLFWSISRGIVSQDLVQKPDTNNFFIQTDAHVYNGNSGGPMLDSEGRVLGMNSNMIAREGGSYGLSIPTIIIEKVLKDLDKYNEVRWATIGVLIENNNTVKEADPSKPAGLSGVKIGDKIVGITIDGDTFDVSESSDLIFRLSTIDYDQEIALDIVRDNEDISIKLKPTYKKN